MKASTSTSTACALANRREEEEAVRHRDCKEAEKIGYSCTRLFAFLVWPLRSLIFVFLWLS